MTIRISSFKKVNWINFIHYYYCINENNSHDNNETEQLYFSHSIFSNYAYFHISMILK